MADEWADLAITAATVLGWGSVDLLKTAGNVAAEEILNDSHLAGAKGRIERALRRQMKTQVDAVGTSALLMDEAVKVANLAAPLQDATYWQSMVGFFGQERKKADGLFADKLKEARADATDATAALFDMMSENAALLAALDALAGEDVDLRPQEYGFKVAAVASTPIEIGTEKVKPFSFDIT